MNGRQDGWMCGWIDGWFDGWIVVGMNGWMGSRLVTVPAWARLD
jgi:hypothetical protein